MSFHVVEFCNEGSNAVVCSSWLLSDSMCHFPKKNYAKFLDKNLDDISVIKMWPQYDVKILRTFRKENIYFTF